MFASTFNHSQLLITLMHFSLCLRYSLFLLLSWFLLNIRSMSAILLTICRHASPMCGRPAFGNTRHRLSRANLSEEQLDNNYCLYAWNRYQGQRQVITPRYISGVQLFVTALHTCFLYIRERKRHKAISKHHAYPIVHHVYIVISSYMYVNSANCSRSVWRAVCSMPFHHHHLLPHT